MATWAQIEARIMTRFDAIEAQISDVEHRLVSVDDRTLEQAEVIKGIGEVVDKVKRDLGYIPTKHDCCAGEAAGLLDELAEDARRRERLGWLAEARAAMRSVS